MNLKIKKGIDLRLAGAVSPGAKPVAVAAAEVAIVPDDFPGLAPKLEVKEGDSVLSGQPLLRQKDAPELKVASPAAGTVKAIVRGERRKIERVVIAVDPQGKAQQFDTKGADTRQGAIGLLCASGMMARMRQRPYDIVPDPAVAPRDIFVTAIDSAPLAAGMAQALKGTSDDLAAGVALLAKVTDGKVYLSVGPDWEMGIVPGAEMVNVEGPHPAGLAGVQAANIAPVNKGETIWTLSAVTLAKIGKLARTGEADFSTIVAVTGSEVTEPYLAATTEGAAIEPLLKGRVAADKHLRVISGNVLTGTAVGMDGYLRFPYAQVTVIPEGDDADEFMGWASLSPSKLSASATFPGRLFGRLYKPDARMLGCRRAMIMSGQYDKYVPMDIMTEYLIKAILARDIEAMEKLGIYEVAPEDFALAEFADTSKLPLQQIVRDGLDFLRKELS